MQKKIVILLLAIGFLNINAFGQDQNSTSQTEDEFVTEIFTVYGNCGMCERTIEGSLKDVEGVTLADWDRETDKMKVSFNPSVIALEDIKQKIADVGYDSDTHRAKDEVYNSLPGCCQYDRPEN
ncbi:MAG: heavy-metal-associated domain-containing protein [Saprospiraceae bacterium]|nr:heavy-metal-associated domain-containing protein [Saprospiraceae bacterium]